VPVTKDSSRTGQSGSLVGNSRHWSPDGQNASPESFIFIKYYSILHTFAKCRKETNASYLTGDLARWRLVVIVSYVRSDFGGAGNRERCRFAGQGGGCGRMAYNC